MRTTVLVFACVPLLLSAAPSPTGARTATVLSEVKRHLTSAQKCIDDGSLDVADAHADVILISDNVKVSVRFDNIPSENQATCLRAIDASLAQWQTALEDTVHFTIVDDPEKADLCMRFRPEVTLQGEQVAGLTNWTRKITHTASGASGTFKADVQLRARGTNFKPMRFEAMRQETEHELGHVFGLDDSEADGDLMGPLDAAHLVNAPRPWEVEAVKSIREQARQIKVATAARRK